MLMSSIHNAVRLCLLAVNAWAVGVEAHVPDQVTLLQPIVVTATTSARNAGDAPASVTVVDGLSLRRRPVNDLADALRGLVGVDLEDTGLGRRGISIRGMSSEHTLMLVDGQRINASSS